MKFSKPNAVQASLVYPAVATFFLSGLGTTGLAVGFLGSLVATPIIFWKSSKSDRVLWKKVSYSALLTGTTVFTSAISGAAGTELIFKHLNRSGYERWKVEQAEMNNAQKEEAKKKTAQNEEKETIKRESKQKGEARIETDKSEEKEKVLGEKKDLAISQSSSSEEKKEVTSIKEAEKPNKSVPIFKFSATAYTVDSKPETTVGNAVLNAKGGYTQWYTEIKSGGYANYRYSHRCHKNGSVSEMDLHGTDNQWKADTNSKCKVNTSSNGTPLTFSLVLPDGFVYQKVRVTTANQISTAPRETPVQKLPDRTAVIVECKKYAVNRSATGKVDWNAFGTGDPRWIGNIATVILSGKTKNEYGIKIPFTIECRGNQDGNIKLVKIVRQ